MLKVGRLPGERHTNSEMGFLPKPKIRPMKHAPENNYWDTNQTLIQDPLF